MIFESVDSVAVSHPRLYIPNKRDFLLFDQVGIVGFDANREVLSAATIADLEYLASAGLVFDARFNLEDPSVTGVEAEEIGLIFGDTYVTWALRQIANDPARAQRLSRIDVIREELLAVGAPRHVDADLLVPRIQTMLIARLEQLTKLHDPSALIKAAHQAERNNYELFARYHCKHLGFGQEAQFIPLLNHSPETGTILPESSHRPVVDVVLQRFPLPSEDVPWESILDFRADEAATRARRRLRRWMANFGKDTRPVREIVQELESLLDEYESHMELHRMRINRSTAETVIVLSAELVENIAKLRFSKAAKSLFIAKDRKLALLEAEAKAPGREVAYIVQAKQAFEARP